MFEIWSVSDLNIAFWPLVLGQVREEVGVEDIRDVTRALNEAPRQLLDCLRAMALVRHTAARLGVTVADRLRVNAVQALKGLQVEESAATGRGHRVQYVGVMRSRWRRWRLWVHLEAMRLVAWVMLLVGEATRGEEADMATAIGG